MGLLMVTTGHGIDRGQLLGAMDGGNVWWIAPTFPVASDIWRDLKKACRNAWTDKSEVERRIELPGGGAVTVKSADNPDSLRGAGLDGVVIDEAASVRQEVWQQSIRPALSDKQGWAVFIGTPKGFNWFFDLFSEAEYLEGWERWQRPSSDNPLLTAKELEAARREVGGAVFSQEYLAQFTDASTGMFKREWFEIVEAGPALGQRVRGWDKAGTEGGGDYSAGVKLCKTAEGVYFVESVIRGQWTSFKRNEVIRQTAEVDGRGCRVWVEQEPGSSGKESAEFTIRQLAGYVVHAERATGDKATRAMPFSAQCEAGNVKIVRGEWNRDFLDELTRFPGGKHDDMVDAAALAFNKLAGPRVTTIAASRTPARGVAEQMRGMPR